MKERVAEHAPTRQAVPEATRSLEDPSKDRIASQVTPPPKFGFSLATVPSHAPAQRVLSPTLESEARPARDRAQSLPSARDVAQRVRMIPLPGSGDPTSIMARNAQHPPSQRNFGWIKFGVPDGHSLAAQATMEHGVLIIKRVFASVRNAKHTEELCVDEAVRLNVDLSAAPNDLGKLRIVSMYTERKPCSPESAPLMGNDNRTQRDEGNCDNYLNNRLNPNLPVYYTTDFAPNHFPAYLNYNFAQPTPDLPAASLADLRRRVNRDDVSTQARVSTLREIQSRLYLEMVDGFETRYPPGVPRPSRRAAQLFDASSERVIEGFERYAVPKRWSNQETQDPAILAKSVQYAILLERLKASALQLERASAKRAETEALEPPDPFDADEMDDR